MSATIPTNVVNFQASPRRSQLASNQLLIKLGEAFGGATFTSRQVSIALGLDFLYCAKKLFRMRRNNLLNVAAREPRIEGGYENRYQISPHGFRKISYLLAKQGVSGNTPKQERDMISQACASQYLLHGTGTVKELFDHVFVKFAAREIRVSPVTDELGMLLGSLNETFLQGDIICNHLFNGSPLEVSYTRSLARATRLQQLGFIPKDIDLSTFIANAIIRGSTEPVILVGLLLQESLKLKAENNARQMSTTQGLFVRNENVRCQSCLDYRLSLIEEKYKSMILKSENDLLNDKCRELQQILWEASEKTLSDRFSHLQHLQYMDRRIDRIFECLVIISKGLNKYPNDDPFVILMRGFVQDSFIIMAEMNRLGRDPYSEN
jgi:DNA-binding HxlR family transcriptional regulator